MRRPGAHHRRAAEEARLSAAGVLAGIRGADGVVADLGGGSVELVRVDAAAATPNRRRRQPADRPVAPDRTRRQSKAGRFDRAQDRRRRRCSRAASGKDLYLVGGAWRALARLHMEQTQLPAAHHPRIRDTATGRPRAFSTSSPASPAARSTASPRSAAGASKPLPVAALILRRLIAAGKPRRIVFSAFGLREGYAYGLLPSEPGGDPGGEPDGDALIASCKGIAAEPEPMVTGDGDRLHRWIAPLFPGPGLADRDAARRRLHRAACWLSDTAWSEHPDYRAAHAFARTPDDAVPADRPCRARLYRIGAARPLWRRQRRPGQGGDPDAARRGRSGRGARARSRAAPRLYAVRRRACSCSTRSGCARDASGIALELPPTGSLFAGEAVTRRLDALGRALALPARTLRRRESRGGGCRMDPAFAGMRR